MARSAFQMAARTLPWAVRGGARITAALLGGAAWLFTRGLPPAYHFGSEVIRRPIDWIFHILLTGLGFWRHAALEFAPARWLLALQAAAWWAATWLGYGRLALGAALIELVLGAVLGLVLEYRSHKVREEARASGS
jgi:hypothetical protein